MPIADASGSGSPVASERDFIAGHERHDSFAGVRENVLFVRRGTRQHRTIELRVPLSSRQDLITIILFP